MIRLYDFILMCAMQMHDSPTPGSGAPRFQ